MDVEKIMASLLKEGAQVTRERLAQARSMDRPAWERDRAREQAQADNKKFFECIVVGSPVIEDHSGPFSISSYVFGILTATIFYGLAKLLIYLF